MKRWIDTHRMRKAARLVMERLREALPHYRQLEFNFDT
jgi:transposase